MLLLGVIHLLALPLLSSSSPCPATPPCPPFLSTPSFPFSFSPGCGHPSFLLRCSPSNRTLLSISSTTFLLLSLPSPSHRSLLLLPLSPRHHHPSNLSPFLPLSPPRGPDSPVRVRWDPSADPYFTLCASCRGSCGYSLSLPSKPFLCLSPPRDLHRPAVLLLLSSLISLACLAALAASVSRALRHRPSPPPHDPMSSFLHLRSPVYSYDHLLASTDGFSPRLKIGDGGFGSVFLASLGDGRLAAVKRLHSHHPAASSSKSFCNEILILSSLHHPNLVRLHGYCCDPRGLLLVYDYVSNGTLAEHLHGGLEKRAMLTWPVRVDVALQTASAIEYLHFSVKPPVVHRDITTSNIFLEVDMRIKVGDFGLSRLLRLPAGTSSEVEYVCTGPQGTPGYLDPDYHRSFRLTEKSDVYSFGVVLLELITGMKAVDVRRERREVGLADMVVSKIQVGELYEVVDPVIVQQGQAVGTVEAVAELAFRCLASDKDDRPDSRELVKELRRIRGKVEEFCSGHAAAG